VQLPIYNEPHVAVSLIRAVKGLDYPADRMTVQVLDDSTDDTTVLVERLLDEIDPDRATFTHVRRNSRTGYKAGALGHGMGISDADFFAVFDADFLPPEGFLRRALIDHSPFDDDKVAFVQGRWTFYNVNQNILTRVQSILIDRHFHIQKPFQMDGRRTVHFNGSGGVWRRSAVEAVGGWTADTLCEDMDLTYRCALSGFLGRYDMDLTCPSEIPADLAAFKSQQRRWAKGSAQCATKLLGRVIRSERIVSPVDDAHVLLGYMIHPLLLIFTLIWPFIVLGGASTGYLWACQVALIVGNIAAVTGFLTTYRVRGGAKAPLMLGVRDVLVSTALGVSLMVNNSIAFVSGLFSRYGVFDRTPKGGAVTAAPRPARRLHWTVYPETAVGIYGLSAGLYMFSLGHTIWGQQSFFMGIAMLGIAAVQVASVLSDRGKPMHATPAE
jgi:cellulose synthase/poly-beta-1,6-N-acetylglucosamine synthase-like glycosyltransferase